MSEKQQQKNLISWFHLQYPNAMIIAIPNAQKFLSKAKNIFSIINSMKAEGYVVGASDLFIPYPKGIYHGMFLEMKDLGKTYASVSKEQRDFIMSMKKAGYYADWAAGFDLARGLISPYMAGLL
ncbi:MAG: hypothetical protein GY718_18240 [Lentisphaerae bacterium]|nr:hypothetical protein [Lentisphaerota bacterium]